jgi:hypothetical protein
MFRSCVFSPKRTALLIVEEMATISDAIDAEQCIDQINPNAS